MQKQHKKPMRKKQKPMCTKNAAQFATKMQKTCKRHAKDMLFILGLYFAHICKICTYKLATGTVTERFIPQKGHRRIVEHHDSGMTIFHLQVAQVILRNIEEYWKWLVILINIDTY